ncbi:hypothetical protein SAMN04489712_105293 [Thermomonospora echinospora]|uniref:Uncharacterized protein n=1 Tax=Thermomonospora echinospora TaxID=1992 RepID=A0A1H6A977_9ACTN|nr:hypothetical protein [Thermomonospora echinospora]SEG45258.1 hypothetical protein SAMN04489712_105293 [Thermomonospora echinospora]
MNHSWNCDYVRYPNAEDKECHCNDLSMVDEDACLGCGSSDGCSCNEP